MGKKKWDYSVSTNTLWASFDYGQVKAKNYAKALEKAKKKLNNDFDKVNDVLTSADVTKGFSVGFDESQIVLTEVLKKSVKKKKNG